MFVQATKLRDDLPRNEPRYVVDIEVRANKCTVPCIADRPNGSTRYAKGRHRVTCYKSDLDKIYDLVETRIDEIDRAYSRNESKVSNAIADATRGMLPGTKEYDERAEAARQRYAGSPEAEFHSEVFDLERRRTGIKPLLSAVVVEELGAPETEQAKLVREVATQLTGVGGQPSGDALSALMQRMNELESKNAELEAMLADKSAPKRRKPSSD